jgi:hypothetical protein
MYCGVCEAVLQEEPSALHMKVITLRFVDTYTGNLNRAFYMHYHRLRFFDVICGYFWPRIGHLANWTKLVK